MKHIVLCADDYGQNPAISQAIVALLQEKRLSATSCMVTSSYWPSHAAWLKPFLGQADLGLHFNLTEGRPLSTALSRFLPLNTLLLNACLRKINQSAVIAELHAQLDAFTDAIGRLPDFIDGHQHVHQFPVIRNALLTVYEERLREHKTYLRCTGDWHSLLPFKNPAYVKQVIIQLTGAIRFKQQLVQRHIPHNLSFAGIYDFSHASEYAVLFPQFLAYIQDGGLIMSHPGLSADDKTDKISASRKIEYAYFSSEQFLQACRDQQIGLSRFQKK